MNHPRITPRLFLLLCALLLSGTVIAADEPPAPAPAPAERSAATLTDLWDGKAAWVNDAEKIGSSFDFHFVSMLRQADELWAYYIKHYTAADGRFKMTVGRARGTDGINWTDDGMVLDVGRVQPPKPDAAPPPAWDDRIASFPGVWKDGETWYLVYEGAAENIGFSPGEIGWRPAPTARLSSNIRTTRSCAAKPPAGSA